APTWADAGASVAIRRIAAPISEANPVRRVLKLCTVTSPVIRTPLLLLLAAVITLSICCFNSYAYTPSGCEIGQILDIRERMHRGSTFGGAHRALFGEIGSSVLSTYKSQ